MGCVYVATNSVNGKKYVGKTVESVRNRQKWHEQCARDRLYLCPRFHRALVCYGLSSFVWEVVFESDRESALNRVEVLTIVDLNSFTPHGYNMTVGGEGASGLVWSDESRQKARLSAKARPPRSQGLAERAKRSISRKGVCLMTPEGRIRVGDSNRRRKGEKRSELAKANLREGAKKRLPASEETREKIRQARLGTTSSLETRAKIGLASRLRKGTYNHSEETKRKLSKAARSRDPEVSARIGRASGETRRGKKRGPYKKKEASVE